MVEKIGSKRHVNLPGVRIDMPSITSKDIKDITFGIKNNVDFIAASFVRNKKDLQILEDLLLKHKSESKIIAKIENQEGLDNIDEICESAWGIMVARGDLGIETSLTDSTKYSKKNYELMCKIRQKIYCCYSFAGINDRKSNTYKS